MSEFTVLAIVKQLMDKLTIDAVERILAYMTTYAEQRVYEIEEGE